MRKMLLVLLGVALLAAACTSGDEPESEAPDSTGPDGSTATSTPAEVVTLEAGELRLISTLRTFDECEVLLDHIHTEAAARVGAYGFEGDGWYGPAIPELRDFAVEEGETTEAAADFGGDDGDALAASDDASEGAPVAGVDFSDTNLQELGVDEPDIVKTDGEQIFVVAGNELVIVDAATAEVTGRVEVATGWNRELFLAGDEVLLISRGDTYEAPIGEVDAAADDAAFFGGSATVIERITVGLTPAVLETMRVEGDYVSARAVDGVARILVTTNPQWTLPFVYPQTEAGEERAAETNRQIVGETDLSDWLPGYELIRDGAVVSGGQLPECGSVHAPTDFSGFGLLSVISLPLGDDLDTSETTSVLAPGETVYASTESIYVATTNWIDAFEVQTHQEWEELWSNRQTNLHRFELTEDGTDYVASGSVAGSINNQFSLSEHDGHLRVVTTTGDPWNESSVSWVRVLRQEGQDLVEVGSVGDIGNGEDVQSVRFVGDIGYVVTFRQIDPFYTVDLSDPENPNVLGELKIPGFSSYLHPIGDGLVLGVGSDADQEGVVTGAKVSLFDVSDLSDPQEIAVWIAPDGWNDIGWEHRSFLWWDAEQIAVIPVQVWSENWSGAVVLQVVDGELVEVGRIDHTDPDDAVPGTTDCEVLTAEDLNAEGDPNDFETELQWMVADGYGLVLSCGDGERAAAVDHDCYEEPWFEEEAARLGIELPADEQLVVCWPNQQLDNIVRSFVIGDELWTLSYPWGDSGQPGQLRTNTLPGLEPGSTVRL